MSKKMLIDASHPEETRVAVMQNGKVEDFDFESLSRKPLRGNIYLARITRVEPSLQAAFVEYGGNRHGFLAFNEIHPDYYQIPVSDREVLRKAEALEAEIEAALAAYETDEDVEADLDEDDDGLRTVDTDVPEDEAPEDDADEKPARRARVDDEPEEEEEEEEPEDGGTDEPEPGDPEDYAGEAGAEEAGWHAIEEEEIAALPPREAREHATEPGKDCDEDAGSDDTAPTDAQKSASTKKDGAEASDADASSEDDTVGEDERKSKPRRRRRRGGRGRRKSAGDDDASDEDMEAKTSDEGDASDEDEKAPDRDDRGDKSRGSQAKAKRDDPRANEIAELERRYEDAKRERAKLLRNYRIQEVVKRRQIMLVQAVKEERGNKGAALTTYLSLAGRYGVLMPNTARGGGVSRKITNSTDRKRLRSAMSDLAIPQGMGLIIRTAGAKRTKAEIKRDYDYLSRLWETIRDETLKSVAPCLIYEEASLIKRAIRDLYDKDTDQVLVQGEEGYREAKDFMKMLMPSHAKNVQPYRDQVPLFLKHHVERQIDEMFQPTVKLPSGGYLVIQQTEALVSVDVNSGKSTKERNVEQTALKTNIEAAKEVARQCKLRDLAGLVVIDFIDMDERKNNRSVEKALKDAMKSDRARIQLGSISDFGLLELSRQRKRSGIVDGTTRLCPLCEGAGAVRSVEMAAMRILRSVEEEALKGKAGHIRIETAMDVALYTLNTKRDWLNRIEATYGTDVEVLGNVHKNGDQYEMTTSGEPRAAQSLRQEARPELIAPDEEPDEKGAANDDEESDDTPKRRRGRGGRSRSEQSPEEKTDASTTKESSSTDDARSGSNEDDEDEDDRPKKRRRRGRRGGRRNRKDGDETETTSENDRADEPVKVEPDAARKEAEPATLKASEPSTETVSEETGEAATDRSEEAEGLTESYTETDPDDAQPAAPEDEQAEAAADMASSAGEPEAVPAAVSVSSAETPVAKPSSEPEGPKRGGWWQRALGR